MVLMFYAESSFVPKWLGISAKGKVNQKESFEFFRNNFVSQWHIKPLLPIALMSRRKTHENWPNCVL